jgi:hypothetical protein
MTDARKVVKKVRRIPSPRKKKMTRLQIVIAQSKENKRLQEMWERDKKIKREASFKKARLVRQQQLSSIIE